MGAAVKASSETQAHRAPGSAASLETRPQTAAEQLRVIRDEVARVYDQLSKSGIFDVPERERFKSITVQPTTRDPADLLSEYKGPVRAAEREGINAIEKRISDLGDSLQERSGDKLSADAVKQILKAALAMLPKAQEAETSIERQLQLRAQYADRVEAKRGEILRAAGFDGRDALDAERREHYSIYRANRGVLGIKGLLKSTAAGKALSRIKQLRGVSKQLSAFEDPPYASLDCLSPVSSLRSVVRFATKQFLGKIQESGDQIARASLKEPPPAAAGFTEERLSALRDEYLHNHFTVPFETALASASLSSDKRLQLRAEGETVARLCFDSNIHDGYTSQDECPARCVRAFEERMAPVSSELRDSLSRWIGRKPWFFDDAANTTLALSVTAQVRDEARDIAAQHRKFCSALQACADAGGVYLRSADYNLPSKLRERTHLFQAGRDINPDRMNHILGSGLFRELVGHENAQLTKTHLEQHLLGAALSNEESGARYSAYRALLDIENVAHLPAVLALTYARPGGYDGPFERRDADGVPCIAALAARFHASSEAMEQLRQTPGAAELTKIFATRPEAIAAAVTGPQVHHSEETWLGGVAIGHHLTNLTCHLIQHGTNEDLTRTVRAAFQGRVVRPEDINLAVIRRFDRINSREDRVCVLDLCAEYVGSSSGSRLAGAFEHVASWALELGLPHQSAHVSALLFWHGGRSALSEEAVANLARGYNTSAEHVLAAQQCLAALESRGPHPEFSLSPPGWEAEKGLRGFFACTTTEESRNGLLMLADAGVHLPFSGHTKTDSVEKLIRHAPLISEAVQTIRAVDPGYTYTVDATSDTQSSPYHLHSSSITRLVQAANQSPKGGENSELITLTSKVLSVRGDLGGESVSCSAESAKRFIQTCQRLEGVQVDAFADATGAYLSTLVASREVAVSVDQATARAEAAALFLIQRGQYAEGVAGYVRTSGLNAVLHGTPEQITALADSGYSDNTLFSILPKVASANKGAEFEGLLARAHLLEQVQNYCNEQAIKERKASVAQDIVSGLLKVQPAVLRDIVAAQYPTEFLSRGLVPILRAPDGMRVLEQVVRSVSARSPLSNDRNVRSYFVDALCDSSAGARDVVAAFSQIKQLNEKLPDEGTRVTNLLLLANAAWTDEMSQNLRSLSPSDRGAFEAIEEVVRAEAHRVLSERYSSELLKQMQERDPVRIAQFAEILLNYEVSLRKFYKEDKIPALRVLATVEMLGAEAQLRSRDPEFLKTFQENIASYVPVEAEREGALAYLKRCYEDSVPALLLPDAEYSPEQRGKILANWNDSSKQFKHTTSEVDGVERGYAIVREVSQIRIPGHISAGLKEAVGADSTTGQLLRNPSEDIGNEVKALMGHKRLLGTNPLDLGALAQQGDLGRVHVERITRASAERQQETVASLQREVDTRIDELKREQKARNQFSELRRLFGSQGQLEHALEELQNQVRHVLMQQSVCPRFADAVNSERELRTRGAAVLAHKAVRRLLEREDLSDSEKKDLHDLNAECTKLIQMHDKVGSILGMQVKSVVALTKLLHARAETLQELSTKLEDGNDVTRIIDLVQTRDPLLAWQISEAARLAPDDVSRNERVSSLLQNAPETMLCTDLDRLEIALKSTQKELAMELTFQPEHRMTSILAALVNQCLDYRSKKNSVGNTVYNMALVDPLKEAVVAYDSEGVARVNGELYVGRARCEGVERTVLVLDTVYTPDKSLVTPSKVVGYLGYCLEKAERLGLPLVVPDRALQKVINELNDSESLWSAAPAKSMEVLIPNSPSGGFYVETRSYTHYTQPTWVAIDGAMILTRSVG